jgi:hypothetical protein
MKKLISRTEEVGNRTFRLTRKLDVSVSLSVYKVPVHVVEKKLEFFLAVGTPPPYKVWRNSDGK